MGTTSNRPNADPIRTRTRWYRALACGSLLLGTASAIAGCDAGEPPPARADLTLPPLEVATTGTPCTDGSERECTLTLGEHDGILSCYHGTQYCAGGTWGSCIGSSTSEIAAPAARDKSGLRLLALGAAGDCTTNPCDPFCQAYEEVPPEPLVAGEGSLSGYSWLTGSPTDSSAGVSAGSNEPCTSGSDCQFNQRCENVMTDSACSHSKCTTGDALMPACDDCVTSICESNPECCQRGWSCAHDVCTTGIKLDATCDDDNPGGSCVADVCAARSSCCSSTWDATCVAYAQTLCGADCGSCGPGEEPSADGTSCYYRNTSNLSWSAARTACQARGTGWDLVTINSSTENTFIDARISGSTWIGYSRNSGSWAWANGTSSYTRWDFGEPGSANCARIETDARWSDYGCSNTIDSFCEGPPPGTSSTNTWSESCVAAVQSVCDATCDTASPPSETGQCSPWQPGEVDASCPASPDLALGVPCEGGVVPVCNHGGVEAPAGIAVSYYAAASSQYPSCTPAGAPKGTCPATTEPIPPGECVNVTCPTAGASGLADTDTLVVNPSGAATECSCLDNWSIYQSGVTCGAPTCAGTSTEASFKPVRMFIAVDRSYSMVCHPPSYPSTCFAPGPGCTCTAGRWDGAVSALKSFFEDADSAGIGVAMDFYPLAAGAGAGDGCAGGATALPTATLHTATACSATPCSNPLVPLGYLTASSAPADTQQQALINALTTTPVSPPNSSSASTPGLPALEGALDWAVAQQLAKPDETFVVVFVTDGEVTACLYPGDSFGNTPTTNAALVDRAADAYAAAGVRTYAIGLEGSSISVLDQIASAGGTSKAFVVGGSNAATIANAFSSALQAISGESASCSLPFSASDESDPDNAVVTYTSGASTTALTRRSGVSECGDGWYFDDDVNPTEVILCPSTCTAVQADETASVRLEVPCAAELEPAVFTQSYQASCPSSQNTLWQFLSYDTTNTAGGEVQFRVRTADSEAELASSAWIDARTATQSEPDCAPATASDCPVDLVELLGDDRSDPFLELEITVTPSAGAETPSVDDWQITFTCPFAQ